MLVLKNILQLLIKTNIITLQLGRALITINCKTEWQQIKGADSTSDKMLKSLDSYADFLRFAASKYKSAQANAINRANRLPKY